MPFTATRIRDQSALASAPGQTQTTDTNKLLARKLVLVPHPRGGYEMLMPDDAAALASGGRRDEERGIFIGGDPTSPALPHGAKMSSVGEVLARSNASQTQRRREITIRWRLAGFYRKRRNGGASVIKSVLGAMVDVRSGIYIDIASSP